MLGHDDCAIFRRLFLAIYVGWTWFDAFAIDGGWMVGGVFVII
jgi:hypothetical protein